MYSVYSCHQLFVPATTTIEGSLHVQRTSHQPTELMTPLRRRTKAVLKWDDGRLLLLYDALFLDIVALYHISLRGSSDTLDICLVKSATLSLSAQIILLFNTLLKPRNLIVDCDLHNERKMSS